MDIDDVIELKAMARYRSGERPCFSTGIHGCLTYGYGELDVNGFFEYPLPYNALTVDDKAKVDAIDNGYYKINTEGIRNNE